MGAECRNLRKSCIAAGTALGLVCAALIASVGPAAAAPAVGSWSPDPSEVPDSAVSFLGQWSNDGGATWTTDTMTSANADVTVSARAGQLDVTAEGFVDWSVGTYRSFEEPWVAPGGYRTTDDGENGVLGVTIDSSSMTAVDGWVFVDRVDFRGSELVRLVARFWAENFNGQSIRRGLIVWDADAPLPPSPTPTASIPPGLWAPATPMPAGTYLHTVSDPSEFIGQGHTHTAPASSVTVTSEPTDDWPELQFISTEPGGFDFLGRFAASSRSASIQPGYYPLLQRNPFHNRVFGGLNVSSDGRGCGRLDGWVAIDALELTGETVTDVELRFEQRCSGGARALHGELHWAPVSAPGTPSPPTNVVASPGVGRASVRWDAPASAGSGGVTGYRVVVYEAGLAVRTLSTAPTTRRLVVDDLPNGVDHSFKVVAVNGSGRGRRSDRSNDVVPGRLDLRPFDTRTGLIRQQYADFVGRPPTSSEIVAGVEAMGTGSPTPAEWVAAMRLRPEWGGRRAPIIRLYRASFGRLPDAGGLRYWGGRLGAGWTLDRLATHFVASAEFEREHGALTNTEFVEWAYESILGREGDEAGLSFWTAQLRAGRSRGSLVREFSESSEHTLRLRSTVNVVLITTGMLRRMPTGEELLSGVQRLEDGERVATVVAEMLVNSEYGQRFA